MQSTGETVSKTVEGLLFAEVTEDALSKYEVDIAYRKRLIDLAKHLGVSKAYMPRKIASGVWTTKDIDKLAEFFNMWPIDFVPGPGDENSE